MNVTDMAVVNEVAGPNRSHGHPIDPTLLGVGSWTSSYYEDQRYHPEILVTNESTAGNRFVVPEGVITAPSTPTERSGVDKHVPIGDATRRLGLLNKQLQIAQGEHAWGQNASQEQRRRAHKSHVSAATDSGSAFMMQASSAVGVDVTAWLQHQDRSWSTYDLHDESVVNDMVDQTTSTGQWTSRSGRR